MFYFAGYEIDRGSCSPISAILAIFALCAASKNASELLALIPDATTLIRHTRELFDFLQPPMPEDVLVEPKHKVAVDFKGTFNIVLHVVHEQNTSFSWFFNILYCEFVDHEVCLLIIDCS